MRRIFLLYIVGSFLKNYNLFNSQHAHSLKKRAGFNSPAGFSLFEVVLVACILAIVGAVAAPHLIDWRNNIRLKGAASELKENLELAKTLAAKENIYIFVEFVPPDGKYRLCYTNLNGNLVPVKEESLPPDVKIDKTHPKYSVTNNKTGFNSRGGADNCTIVLTNLQKKSKLISISVIGKIEVKN
jgi:Tfp pilus assembly protein FimT